MDKTYAYFLCLMMKRLKQWAIMKYCPNILLWHWCKGILSFSMIFSLMMRRQGTWNIQFLRLLQLYIQY